jgi:hypothetical protein
MYQTAMTLTPHEIDTFAAAEATIERGLQTFYEVGEALLNRTQV